MAKYVAYPIETLMEKENITEDEIKWAKETFPSVAIDKREILTRILLKRSLQQDFRKGES